MKKNKNKIKKIIIVTIITLVAIVVIVGAFSFLKYLYRGQMVAEKFKSPIDARNDSIFREGKVFSEWFPEQYNQQSRLYYLCKAWGFAKYFHENKQSEIIDVDQILLENIPVVMEDIDKETFNSVLVKVINVIQLDTLKGKNPFPDIQDYSLISNGWMDDSICLKSETKDRLLELFYGHTGAFKPKKLRFVYNRDGAGSVRQNNEKEYSDYNDVNIRLLGLFRYWNMINFFFPYKNFMDQHWDQSLYESIPDFLSATTDAKYRKAIYRLTNLLRDTHASYPPAIDTVVFGEYRPKFRMMNINDTLIITKIRDPENYTDSFEVGDVVLTVDGMNAHYLYDSLQSYVCGGNWWSNQRFVCNAVLSRKEKYTHFQILRGLDTLQLISSNESTEKLHRKNNKEIRKNEKKDLYQWITDDVAYLNLESLTPDNFDKNFSPIKQANVIILDLRNYPDNFLISNLSDHFIPPTFCFAKGTYADVRFPGMLRYHNTAKFVGNRDYYKGQVIVLVNEETGSFAEYVAMLLQANPKTILVGTPTSGSNGNISMLTFPGDIKTIYSGIGIYYPDLRPTQRVGVQIDYVVTPSVQSIKNKVDVILEKAVFITNEYILMNQRGLSLFTFDEIVSLNKVKF